MISRRRKGGEADAVTEKYEKRQLPLHHERSEGDASGGSITAKEYLRAKKYYQKLTGADIVLAD
jgi:hypothetical protein